MPNNNFEHIIHKHSSVVTNGNPKLPTTNNVEYGEIAVNYAKDHETISLKNSNNEIVTFSSDNAIKKLINDDSYVISNSLNDLNSRIGAVEDRKMDKINGTSSQFVKGDGSLDSNTYATQNYVNSAVAVKIDKVSSSTDNAVVRFDGTSGNIQNSGVTINDSNHLTAAKLITSGGTAYDYVMGDGSLKDRYFQTLNTFSNQDSSKLYLEPVMDCMYAAHLKWNVSATIDNTLIEDFDPIIVSAGQIAGWFNGDYGRVGQYVDANEVLKITIQTSDPENSYMTTYSEGRLLLNFYNYGLPLSVSGRCYSGGSSSKVWTNLTFATQRGGRNGIYISNTLPTPYLRIIELTIVGQKVSGDPNKTNLSSIEMMRTRCGIGDYPIVTKYGIAQRMYGELTAPKFITSGGTSSQFVKGNGTLDSTTYAPLASPALTGTPTAPTATAGTNTTQIATTAFVKSAIDTQIGNIETLLASI